MSGRFRWIAVFSARDLRASPGKFVVAAAAIAVAAATVCGVRSLTVGFSRQLADDARQWIGADVAAYLLKPPSEAEWTALRSLGGQIRWTLVAETSTMATSGEAPDPVMVNVKIVDPAEYPFYGPVQLASGEPLAKSLTDDSVVVSSELPAQLHVHPGDRIHLGGLGRFRIAGIVTAEPDRFAGTPTLAARVILSRKGADDDSTSPAGVLFYRLLARIPPRADRMALCGRLESIFPESEVIDYTTPTPQLSIALEWVMPFLNALALLALALGAIAAGVVADLGVLKDLDTIAILKALGASSRRIMCCYLFQNLSIAAVASIAGAVCGRALAAALAKIGSTYLGGAYSPDGSVGIALESILWTICAVLVAALISLSSIRSIPAAAILRRNTGEKSEFKQGFLDKARRQPAMLPALAAFTALWLFRSVDSWMVRAYFLIGIAAAWAAMFALTQVSLSGLAAIARALRYRLPFAARHGAVNLYRFRRQSRMVILSVASSVALIVVSHLGERDVGARILESLPMKAPNLWLLNLDGREADLLSSALRRETGTGVHALLIPTALMTLVSAGNTPLDSLREKRGSWIQRVWPATCSDSIPDSTSLAAGEWWNGRRTGGDAPVAFDRDTANLLGVRVGSEVKFISPSGPLRARVAALVRVPPAQRFWYQITFSCHAFEGLDLAYNGGVTLKPADLARVRDRLRVLAPEATIVEMTDMIDGAGRAGKQAARVGQIVAAFVLLTGVCLLIALTTVLRLFRVREIATLRAVGGRKRTILVSLLIEYFALGGVAGILGGCLGCVAASLILREITWRPVWMFDPQAVLFAASASAAITSAAGIVGSFDLFRATPLEVFRRLI